MATTPKVAVILSGCGVYDGAEIQETVFTLYALDHRGAQVQCFAPNISQTNVVNHLTGEIVEGDIRNVLEESARIVRGDILPLSEFKASAFDGLVFPGGFGVAKNLSSFAFDGANCTVIDEVEHAINDMVMAQKPIAALCIAPTIIAKLLDGADLTIGQDEATAAAIKAMGAHHTETGHVGVVIDPKYKLVTAPCYMLESTVTQIADGANAAMEALLAIIEDGVAVR